VPESIIPSADAPGPKAFGVSFQMLVRHAVRLPESFRGGCSFGAGAEADLSRRDVLQIRGKHGPAKPVNAAAAFSTGCACPSCVLRQAYDPPAQFLDSTAGLV